ncbi:hypothetical protein ACL07V_37460 [Streptomyces sp. MB22_4]|uniref:DUF6197 family protein n=1 Tax=Streptomyces sp. MB22_4 TaxID=3383120 RepID=UPI00399FD9E2
MATPPAAPARAPHTTPAPAHQTAPVHAPAGLLDPPPWSHRILPRAVRNAMEALGWWTNPVPQTTSRHLAQTLETLRTYGWGKSLDFSPTGRMCIRGAQTALQMAGHVTPDTRARAVHYLQLALQEIGVDQPFFAWNDMPERTFPDVEKRLTRAAYLARSNGE